MVAVGSWVFEVILLPSEFHTQNWYCQSYQMFFKKKEKEKSVNKYYFHYVR